MVAQAQHTAPWAYHTAAAAAFVKALVATVAAVVAERQHYLKQPMVPFGPEGESSFHGKPVVFAADQQL